MRYPPEVLRREAIALGASLLLSIVGAGALIYGLRAPEASARVLAGFGALALVGGSAMAWLTVSWFRRATRLVAEGRLERASITLLVEADSDSTTLYAQVSPVGRNAPALRVAVLPPAWDYRSQLGKRQDAGLFIEPGSRRLMAMSTAHGMLWCMPRNGLAAPPFSS